MMLMMRTQMLPQIINRFAVKNALDKYHHLAKMVLEAVSKTLVALAFKMNTLGRLLATAKDPLNGAKFRI